MPDGLEPVEGVVGAAPVGDQAAALLQRAVPDVHGLRPGLSSAGGDVVGPLGRVVDPLLEAEADGEGVGDRVAELAARDGLHGVEPGVQHG